VFCVAALWIGLPKQIAASDRLAVSPLIRFFAKVAVYLTLFNALMFVDGWLIKRLATEYFAARTSELGTALDQLLPWANRLTGYHLKPSTLADVQTGYYAAVQNLARLSYQAIIAATFVVFPLVSRSTFTEDRETTRSYIQVTLRYSLIFAMTIAVVMAANPVDILGVIYAPDFAHLGGPALPWLALGNVAFSVFAINGTILNSAGATRPTIAVAAVTLVVATAGNYMAIPWALAADRMLEVAAIVTGGAMLIGAVSSGVILVRRLGAFIPVRSVVRIAIATGLALAIGRVVPFHGKLMALAEACLVAVVFLGTLVVSRELGARDLEAIKAVRKKRAAEGGEP
jgi:stage V sporulation protein B